MTDGINNQNHEVERFTADEAVNDTYPDAGLQHESSDNINSDKADSNSADNAALEDDKTNNLALEDGTENPDLSSILHENSSAAYDTVSDIDNYSDDKGSDNSIINSDEDMISRQSDEIRADTDNTGEDKDAADESRPQKDTVNNADIKDEARSSKKSLVYKALQVMCVIGFIIFAALFIDEVVIQPLRIRNSIEKTRDLYKASIPTPKADIKPEATARPDEEETASVSEPSQAPTPSPDPNRDEFGRLLQFSELLAVNEDVKGWLTIPDTNIDYVVVQSDKENPEYYLDKDIYHEYSKAGTLFLDVKCSVEDNSKSLTIYGHNMVSTPEKMFRDLTKYKVAKSGKSKNEVPDFYKEHPVINFDTIYQTGQWKIFSVFITNGSVNKRDEFFNYTRSSFKDTSDFLNYVYQLRIRSELNIDCVDITDTDQLLVLSTCSYEVDNYRTVIVARRVRDGEDASVDVDSVTVNMSPLYPASYYYRYGGKAPKLPKSFEEALESGLINWYTPPELLEERMKQAGTASKAEDDKPEAIEDKKIDTEVEMDKNTDAEAGDTNKKEAEVSDTIKAEAEARESKNTEIGVRKADKTASEVNKTDKALNEDNKTDKAKTEGKKTDKASTKDNKAATEGNTTEKSETKSDKSKKSKTEATETELKSSETKKTESNEAVGTESDDVTNNKEANASDTEADDVNKGTDVNNADTNDGDIANDAGPELMPLAEEADSSDKNNN